MGVVDFVLFACCHTFLCVSASVQVACRGIPVQVVWLIFADILSSTKEDIFPDQSGLMCLSLPRSDTSDHWPCRNKNVLF